MIESFTRPEYYYYDGQPQLQQYHTVMYYPPQRHQKCHHHSTAHYALQEMPSPPLTIAPITPHENDILMGRGGKNNIHSGNEALRELARKRVIEYTKADKKQKWKISVELVAQVKAMTPAGRFLKKDPKSLTWKFVPDDLAREKASQCLRDAVAVLKKRQRDDSNDPETSEEKLDDFEPLPMTYGSVPDNALINMEIITNKKRRRFDPAQKDEARDDDADDDGTVHTQFSIPVAVFAGILEKPQRYQRQVKAHMPLSPMGATIVSHDQAFPHELDSLHDDDANILGDDTFVW